MTRATVRMRPVFQCDGCGNTQWGDAVELNIGPFPEGVSRGFLSDCVAATHVSNNHMPNEWASFLRDGVMKHYCPDCHS